MVLLVGCRTGDEKNDPSSYFPVLPYIQSQVRHIDTSVYSIIQVRKNGNASDTTYLKREDFRKAAADFLSIPDIGARKLRKKYRESRHYDEDIQKVIISYESKEDDVDVLRQDIVILPTLGTQNEVESIYIERFLENKRGSVQKKMLWEVNRRFQVTSIAQARNQPEKIETVEVSWTNSQ